MKSNLLLEFAIKLRAARLMRCAPADCLPETHIASRYSRVLHDQLNRTHQLIEFFRFPLQLLAAFRRQFIETCLAIVLRHTPLRFHPSFDEHAIERWIERPVFNDERAFRGFLDSL